MPRIALLQNHGLKTPADNLDHTTTAIRKAAAGGAHIVCTMELFTTPYFCRTQDTRFFDLAEPMPGPITDRMEKLAAELGIVIIASAFERRAPGIYHNSAAIIDADGTLLGIYRKMHIPQDPGFEEKFYFTPGDTGYKAWDTQYGKIGVLICWDQWYPEAARLSALHGAQILFYPTAIGWLPDEKTKLGDAQHCAWESVQRGHAVANACYVATTNRVGTEGNHEFWGQSFVSDFYGQVIQRASITNEEILYADCDFDALENHRRIWPFFRDRRIDSYNDITQRFIDPS